MTGGMGKKSTTVHHEAYEDANADGNCYRCKWPMLDLV